ncbi:ArsR family transcriptional regulator [Haloprofundus sp. MHR1]|uniref:DUF7342 family protein n=1 Tax=Haloprofundus sp. MHR1 TaxID=2572921 RepID=UPI0010BF6596|nr:ArsR family transcriptional regulator [Haloprofundus sp. MHR1]QCJ45955.1 ArsR family transcriptional regulator [Haloprofundus sp. MHR1]
MTDDAPGSALWKAQTSAFDRVRSIAVTLDQPRTADWIADQALVAGNSARDHLERLAEMGVLQIVSGDQALMYQPDPLYTRMQALRELLDSRSRDDLVGLRAALQEQLEDWREEYNVVSSGEIRTRAAQTETAQETRELREIASDWALIQYRLRLVEDAIEHYAEYTGSAPEPV